MNFITVKNYNELSLKAAGIICGEVLCKPNCVLGLATGSTPVGTYTEMAKRYNSGEVDFSKVTSINLDEYLGLDGENEQSYRYFMNENLFNKININKENTFVPKGNGQNPKADCEAYEALIKEKGGIDLQLLGIGFDGHIGFNEPDEVFVKDTHVVDLDPSTIEANARFFTSKDEVPKKAITLGIGGVMSAKKVLLIANGKGKKDILEKSFFGPITPKVPASILQLHKNVTVIYSEE